MEGWGAEPSSKSINKICEAFGIDEFQFYRELNNTKFCDDSDKFHLTAAQSEMLSKWMLLNQEEKTVVDNIMTLFVNKKK